MSSTIYLFGCEFMCSMQNVPRVARSFPVHDNLCWGWLVLHSAKHFSAQVFIGSECNDLLLFDLKQLEKYSGVSRFFKDPCQYNDPYLESMKCMVLKTSVTLANGVPNRSVSIIAGLEYGMKQWTGMMEWKVEWNSEHTQLQLTCI